MPKLRSLSTPLLEDEELEADAVLDGGGGGPESTFLETEMPAGMLVIDLRKQSNCV
jgi:hypothetical protein